MASRKKSSRPNEPDLYARERYGEKLRDLSLVDFPQVLGGQAQSAKRPRVADQLTSRPTESEPRSA